MPIALDNGRCSPRHRYAGSFKTKTEALERRRWVTGELAALRVPDIRALEQEPVHAPTVAEAAARWQGARLDLAENTKTRHGLELNRSARCLAAAASTSSLVSPPHGGTNSRYEGGLSATGPTRTDSGLRQPMAACSADVKLSGSVTLTRSNWTHGPAAVSTSLQ